MNNANNHLFEKKAGAALILFTILLLVTIVLHPAGGSMEYLIRISRMIIIAHSIAIVSLPLGWVGFWGVTRKTGTENIYAIIAFAASSIGLIAAMLAATTNGIVLPIFLRHYSEAIPEMVAILKPIVRYGFSVNQAFDYIYTGAFSLAIACWSIAILQSKKLPAWLGGMGLILSAVIIVLFFAGLVAPNTLSGVRLFVTAIFGWFFLTGVVLYKNEWTPQSTL